MGPQETKDERRAIYFGPLFPRRSRSARSRACESPEAEDLRGRVSGAKAEVEGGGQEEGEGENDDDDELPRVDGCREPHAIKAKRYETLLSRVFSLSLSLSRCLVLSYEVARCLSPEPRVYRRIFRGR